MGDTTREIENIADKRSAVLVHRSGDIGRVLTATPNVEIKSELRTPIVFVVEVHPSIHRRRTAPGGLSLIMDMENRHLQVYVGQIYLDLSTLRLYSVQQFFVKLHQLFGREAVHLSLQPSLEGRTPRMDHVAEHQWRSVLLVVLQEGVEMLLCESLVVEARRLDLVVPVKDIVHWTGLQLAQIWGGGRRISVTQERRRGQFEEVLHPL